MLSSEIPAIAHRSLLGQWRWAVHTSGGNRPCHDGRKLIGDVPSATAILDRFLHHAEIITITGKSYRLKDRSGKEPVTVSEREPAVQTNSRTAQGIAVET
jgi:hypothetical protein